MAREDKFHGSIQEVIEYLYALRLSDEFELNLEDASAVYIID